MSKHNPFIDYSAKECRHSQKFDRPTNLFSSEGSSQQLSEDDLSFITADSNPTVYNSDEYEDTWITMKPDKQLSKSKKCLLAMRRRTIHSSESSESECDPHGEFP